MVLTAEPLGLLEGLPGASCPEPRALQPPLLSARAGTCSHHFVHKPLPDQPLQPAVPLSQLLTSFLCFQTHGFCERPDCPPWFSRLGSHLEGSSR